MKQNEKFNLVRKIKLNLSDAKPNKGNFADYPWDECIADQLDRGYSEESANNICGWIKANYQTNFAEGDSLEGACWPGYEAIGMKDLDGRMVPNCVPIKEEQSKVVKEGFPIPSPSGDEDENTFISRCMGEIGGEYEQDVALGICYSKWRGE